MTSVTQPSQFATRVRSEMTKQKLSVRGLARRMDPQNLDRARRNLHRWLDEGITPNQGSRREVAIALALPEDSFASDDEEEPHPMVAELYRALRQIMRDEIRAAAEA